MKKNRFQLILPIFTACFILTSERLSGQVGINTTQPTKMLDINGDMRIRLLPVASGGTYQLTAVDANGNISSATLSIPTRNIGDIKKGFQSADHDGWYLLDGRPLNTLPSGAQNNANSLSLTSLPDARGRLLKTKTGSEQLAALGGSNTVTLSRANLPSYNFTGTTSADGQHNHSVHEVHQNTSANQLNFRYSPTCCAVYGYNSETRYTSTQGDHTHSFSGSSEGGGTAFSIIPQHISVNTFIYLGN
ncbi:hypothetical protein [Chryseobacterium sp. sg2396]|uniref:hypothetical protein n=1 Tax=Chryseobacterium sp. sg2396 TaxID=3276280 RepID=UPI00366B591E